MDRSGPTPGLSVQCGILDGTSGPGRRFWTDTDRSWTRLSMSWTVPCAYHRQIWTQVFLARTWFLHMNELATLNHPPPFCCLLSWKKSWSCCLFFLQNLCIYVFVISGCFDDVCWRTRREMVLKYKKTCALNEHLGWIKRFDYKVLIILLIAAGRCERARRRSFFCLWHILNARVAKKAFARHTEKRSVSEDAER